MCDIKNHTGTYQYNEHSLHNKSCFKSKQICGMFDFMYKQDMGIHNTVMLMNSTSTELKKKDNAKYTDKMTYSISFL